MLFKCAIFQTSISYSKHVSGSGYPNGVFNHGRSARYRYISSTSL